ncbi:MAG: D-alanyl-D-alanine carboxypeptidase family protein [Oliverpabstia sp.]|nr:D-alanyl-D-alanine carboxypeptidase [Lachnospiraceae bacterium]MDY5026151.1 D-alanyl-D-alanine carboxypeptidase family protein [Oliverpabstia sp.]
MRKVWMSLLAMIWLLAGCPWLCHAAEMEDTELYARSACLMDADSGRVLYSKDGENQMPMASTTKVMTCILALELGHPDELVTASAYAASQPKVHMGVKEGEQFWLNDLLFALMLNSDNDAAVMIAEHIAGSVEAFAEKMNLKAREIGCEHTYFITPNGLDAEDEHGVHSTTAVDLARILRYCIMESPQKDMFLEITRMPSYTFWNNSHTKTYNCTNHNSFLNMMDGALTGKTGFTADAGYCYVGALQWEGKTLIVSLLACGWPNNKGYKWADTRKLMTYGLRNYNYRDVFERKNLGSIPVENGQYEGMKIGETAMTPVDFGTDQSEISLSLLLRQDENVRVNYQIPSKLKAPVKEGQQVGKVQYFLGNELLKEYPIYAQRQVDEIDYSWCLKQVEEQYLQK